MCPFGGDLCSVVRPIWVSKAGWLHRVGFPRPNGCTGLFGPCRGASTEGFSCAQVSWTARFGWVFGSPGLDIPRFRGPGHPGSQLRVPARSFDHRSMSSLSQCPLHLFAPRPRTKSLRPHTRPTSALHVRVREVQLGFPWGLSLPEQEPAASQKLRVDGWPYGTTKIQLDEAGWGRQTLPRLIT